MAIKAAEREGKRHSISLRVTAEVRKGLEAAASASGRSMTQEAEARLERSFDDVLLRGDGMELLHALRRVVTKVLRSSRDYHEISDDDPETEEIKTQRELRSAINFVMGVFAGAKDPLPPAFSPDGPSPGEWGTGDIGRLYAEAWLEQWADDSTPLAKARAREIVYHWTPGPPSRSFKSILAEEDGGRHRNAAAEPRRSDSGLDDDMEVPLDAPSEKPKRTRRAKPKA